jgi:hypothetical protein|tara:strand:- start:335 stop:538 length:204 start_codon:yes stop_codon:yes gene_type:complete
MKKAHKILSTYVNGDLMSETFLTEDRKHYGVRFYKNNVFIKDEIYKGKSESYAEDAAENYLYGIKTI